MCEDGAIVEVEDGLEWARWFETADRTVTRTAIEGGEVSTVFLGLDHSFGSGPLRLFETLVFGGWLDGQMERYATKEEALVGHAAMVEKTKENT